MIATALNLQLFPARPISSWSCRKLPQRTLTVTIRGVDGKLSDIFLTSLATAADAGDDSATSRLIRKFVKSSSMKASHIALQRLLSIDDCSFANISHLALPLYSQITEASWFSWDPKLVAELIAWLEKQGLHRESLILFSDAVSKTMHREQKVVRLYSNLVYFHSKHKNKSGFDDSCTRLTETLRYTKSSKVRYQGYKSLVDGFCEMGQPREAEVVIKEMTEKGFKPSRRVLMYCLYSNVDNKIGFDDSCTHLTQTLRYTDLNNARRQGYDSMVYGFCKMGQPREAEDVIKEMTEKGLVPSKPVLRYVVYLYGRLGLFEEMLSSVKKMEQAGFAVDIIGLYSNLVKFHAKHKNKSRFDDLCTRLTQTLSYANSGKVRRQGYDSLVYGFCKMGQLSEAEDVIKEMTEKGLVPSKPVLRYVVYTYGQLGLFEEMSRSVKKMEQAGFAMDISRSNMILSAYGARGKLVEMAHQLRVMKSSGIEISIWTYNTVLKSCPMFMSLLQDLKTLPISLEGLEQVLDSHESLVIKELAGFSLEGLMVWGDSEVKLDLHKMRLGSAYLIMLQWMQEMQHRLGNGNGNCAVPAEVSVITGSGKHSVVRGKSLLKEMVKELMIRTGSPMRIDEKNIGRFVAKGEDVKNWLDLFVKIA